MNVLSHYRRKIITGAAACFLSACASVTQDMVANDIKETQKGPRSTPTKNITNFASALRCMDNTMIQFGVPRTKFLVEDLEDRTSEIKAGTRDMLITAVSDMNKRSQAIELVAFGNDSGNAISFLNAAGKKNAYEKVPPFDIRGSISQLDKNVLAAQADAGVGFSKWGAGISTSAKGSVLGLDLSMISTENLAVVPGVTARNSVIIAQSSTGADADGTIKKAGISFSFNISSNEGAIQGLRNLVELGVIELFGKLYKLPYWNCLGADPQEPSVKQEINDWFDGMRANNQLITYVQVQLKRRGTYNGDINGINNPEFEKAIALYKISMSLFRKRKISPVAMPAPILFARE